MAAAGGCSAGGDGSWEAENPSPAGGRGGSGRIDAWRRRAVKEQRGRWGVYGARVQGGKAAARRERHGGGGGDASTEGNVAAAAAA